MALAYGHGDKTALKRTVDAGGGVLSARKYAELLSLRQAIIEALGLMAKEIFVQDPLRETPTKAAAEAKLSIFKKTGIDNLNAAYVEKLGMMVVPNVMRQYPVFFRRLKGRGCNVEKKLEKPCKKTGRLYHFVPVELQGSVTDAELSVIAAEVKKDGVEFFRDVILRGKLRGLNGIQVAVVAAIHAQCVKEHRVPEYGKDPRFVAQIHLDYRLLPADQKYVAAEYSDQVAVLLEDTQNIKYQHFIDISKAVPRSGRIRVPVVLEKHLAERLGVDGKETHYQSLILEIGPKRFRVKLCAQRKQPLEATINPILCDVQKKLADKKLLSLDLCKIVADHINSKTALVGLDFGYRDTVSIAVVRRDREISAEHLHHLMSIRQMGIDDAKAAMKTLFQTHEHASQDVLETVNLDGSRWMAAINAHCEYIDRLSSQISSIYNRLESHKALINAYLGQPATELIPEKTAIDDLLVEKLHRDFFCLLKEVQRLKVRRRNRFSKIEGLKKSWLGYCAGIAKALCVKHDAAYIHEDLTIMPIDKRAPDYKGRTFNRMLRNGSRGIFMNIVSGKLSWNGILAIAIPSPYTSQACVKHSAFGKRRLAHFKCKVCGVLEHADLHAGGTIASTLLIQPLTKVFAAQ